MRTQWPRLHILLVANWIVLAAAFGSDLLLRAEVKEVEMISVAWFSVSAVFKSSINLLMDCLLLRAIAVSKRRNKSMVASGSRHGNPCCITTGISPLPL